MSTATNAGLEGELHSGLTSACQRFFAADAVVSDLAQVTGGASRQTVTFDVEVAGGARAGRHALVLRRDPPRRADVAATGRGMAADRATEFAVIAAMFRAGVRVPEPLFLLQPQDGLGEGFVMRRMPGTAIARKLLRDAEYADARRNIVGDVGAALARIHAQDPASLPKLPFAGAAEHVAALRQTLDQLGVASPVFELALAWLDRNRPPPSPVRPVHGDFRTGNFLADASGLTAVLDWEAPHLGDPLFDLGWFCTKSWRFGEIDKPAGGFGSREQLWSAYQAAGGAAIDPQRARWWEIFGTARWGIICLTQADRHLSGAQRSVELCTIGRRAAENEYDLIELFRSMSLH